MKSELVRFMLTVIASVGLISIALAGDRDSRGPGGGGPPPHPGPRDAAVSSIREKIRSDIPT
jgi:hypothetical protein